jgi:hypothetical protein
MIFFLLNFSSFYNKFMPIFKKVIGLYIIPENTSKFGYKVTILDLLKCLVVDEIHKGGRRNIFCVSIPQGVLKVPVPIPFIQRPPIVELIDEGHFVLIASAFFVCPFLVLAF